MIQKIGHLPRFEPSQGRQKTRGVFSRLQQTVIVILDTENGPYLVCTRDRGVARGDPYFAGQNEVTRIVLFDQESGDEKEVKENGGNGKG